MKFSDIFGGAKWIGTGNDSDIPLIRQSFNAKAGEHAEISIIGFGVFILYINGVRVHNTECLPLASDYENNDFPKGEKLKHRVYVEKFDISEHLLDGENVVSVLLGNGWYNRPIWEESFGDGRKKTIYRILFEDGRAVESSLEACWVPSHVTDNHYNKGEDQDLRIDITAARLPAFAGEVRPVIIEDGLRESEPDFSDCPRDVITGTYEFREIEGGEGYKLYDLGINTTFYPTVDVFGGEGEEVKITFSEDVLGGGKDIDPTHAHDQRFNLILDGRERTVRPEFGWICARYARVEGNAVPRLALEVRSDIKPSAEFDSDNEVLNYLYRVYLHTQLINMHTGIPSDCPQIERRGYTGDGQLVARASMLMTDSERFYRKWLRDISDCQDRLSGHVQYTAPYTRAGGGVGGWGSAIVTVPLEFYERFGDITPLREMYPQMHEYLRYMDNHSENLLVTSDTPGEWCLGDWVTPEKVIIPPPYVNTYFYVKSCQKMIRIARLLGKEEDIPALEKRIAERKAAITAAYYNPWDNCFVGGTQGADAFALDIGLGTERTLKALIDRYDRLGYYDTGIFGTELVTRMLFENGRADIAVRLLTAGEPHGFGRFMREGRTTLPEYWGDLSRSLCHPMFGAVASHLFEYVLGIRQAEGSVGYESIVISPLATDSVRRASGSVLTAKGERISVAYTATENATSERPTDRVTVTAFIPEGVAARVVIGEYTAELKPGKNEVVALIRK